MRRSLSAALAFVALTWTVGADAQIDLRRREAVKPQPARPAVTAPAIRRPAAVPRIMPNAAPRVPGAGAIPRVAVPRGPVAAPPIGRVGTGVPAGGRGLPGAPVAGVPRAPGAQGLPGRLRAQPPARGLPQGGLGGRGPNAFPRDAALPGQRGGLGRGPAALGQPGLPRFGGRPLATRAGLAWRGMSQRFYVPPPRSPGPAPGRGIARTAHEMQFSGVPPRGEVRYVPREIVVQVGANVPRAQVEATARQLGIATVASENLEASGRVVYHFRAADGREIPDVIRQLERSQIVASAQPNYVYKLEQSVTPAPSAAADEASVAAAETLPAGDTTQYIIDKLQLHAVHKQARGRGVPVAVIDSEIDSRHPDLQRGVKDRFDPTGRRGLPDTHGTGMAGAIVSRYRLLGVAPDADVIAIKAFDAQTGSPEATSFQILKGIDYAMRRKVRIINMSFAGPYDVMLQRKLQEAYNQGIVLVAAAGNAGPQSPPLYPAADPNVIAVTATDAANQPFARANRGKHIAVAAPGVDILVPSPGGGYQLTTGTSVAAAHVSGVVALMLEKRPELTPDDVRAVLVGSAMALRGAKPEQAGAGLVNPASAITYDVPETAAPAVASTPSISPASRAAATPASVPPRASAGAAPAR